MKTKELSEIICVDCKGHGIIETKAAIREFSVCKKCNGLGYIDDEEVITHED